MEEQIYKRYEYFTKEGKVWTRWFYWNSDIRDKWQLKNKLVNQYKMESELTEDELKEAKSWYEFKKEPKQTKKKATSKKATAKKTATKKTVTKKKPKD